MGGCRSRLSATIFDQFSLGRGNAIFEASGFRGWSLSVPPLDRAACETVSSMPIQEASDNDETSSDCHAEGDGHQVLPESSAAPLDVKNTDYGTSLASSASDDDDRCGTDTSETNAAISALLPAVWNDDSSLHHSEVQDACSSREFEETNSEQPQPEPTLLDRLEDARACGNSHFEAKRLEEAAEAYEDGLRLITVPEATEELETGGSMIIRSLGVLHSNCAEVFLKLSNGEKAFEASCAAIERLQAVRHRAKNAVPKNVIQKDLLKAFLRKARAQSMLRLFDEALVTLCTLPVEERFVKGRQGFAVGTVRSEIEDQRSLACTEPWAIALRKAVEKVRATQSAGPSRSSATARLVAWSAVVRAFTVASAPRDQSVRLLRLLGGFEAVIQDLQDKLSPSAEAKSTQRRLDGCHVLRVLWLVVSSGHGKDLKLRESEATVAPGSAGVVSFVVKLFERAVGDAGPVVNASSCWALAVLAEVLPLGGPISWTPELLAMVLQHLRAPHGSGGAADLPGGPQAAALRVLVTLEPGSAPLSWLAPALPPFSEWWPALCLASRHFGSDQGNGGKLAGFSMGDGSPDDPPSSQPLPPVWWDALQLVSRCCLGATSPAEVTASAASSHMEPASTAPTPWWANLSAASSASQHDTSDGSSPPHVTGAWPWRDRDSVGHLLLAIITVLRIAAPPHAIRRVERMKLLRRFRLGANEKPTKNGQTLLSMQPARVLYFDSSLAPAEAVAWATMALSLLASQAKHHVGITAGAISVLGAWPALTGLCVPTAPAELYAALMSLLVTCSQLPACAQRLAQLGLGTVLLAPPSLRERLAKRSTSGALASETILATSSNPSEAPPPIAKPCRGGHADLPWALLLCRLSQHSAFHAHLGLALECPSNAASCIQGGVATFGSKGGLPHCTASEDAKASAETLVDVLLHCLEDRLRETTVSVTTAVLHTLRLLTNVAPSCLDEMPCEQFAAAIRKAERCSAMPQGAPLANELLALLSELRLMRGPLVRAWSAHVRERGTLWERWLFDRVAAVTKSAQCGTA